MANTDELLRVLDEISEQIATAWQNAHDGGWTEDPLAPPDHRSSDVWSTAEMVLWLDQYDHSKYRSQIANGLEYLSSCQHVRGGLAQGTSDGGWGSKPDRASDPTSTVLALLAFVRSNKHETFQHPIQGIYPFVNNMTQARDWLINNVNAEGGWSLLPQAHSSAFCTCWASIALRECIDVPGLDDHRIKAAILPGSLSLVENSIQAGGGWGEKLSQPADAIGTAYCTYLLLYMGRAAAAAQGISWLVTYQANDGSWEPGPAQSPVEATARAILALCSSTSNRNQPRVAAAINSGINYLLGLYRSDSGWPEQPGESGKVWTTYYACRALLSHIDAVREDQGGGGLPPSRKRKRIFIVHGHHAALRSEVKGIVQKLNLEPVVLEEMPNRGVMTIREKFEYYAKQEGVDFALVLLTPDDMNATENAMAPRGNAIYELGWFEGTLGRERVCILWDPAVKLPSDLDGVMRIDIRKDKWQNAVIEELRAFILLQDVREKDQE